MSVEISTETDCGNDIIKHDSSDISISNDPVIENHSFKIPNCYPIGRQKKKFPGPAGLITDKHNSNLSNDKNVFLSSQVYMFIFDITYMTYFKLYFSFLHILF